MKKILHFHPNAFYAQKFVGPLINAEKKNGFYSKLISETTNGPSDHLVKFSITPNPILLVLRCIKLLILLKKTKPDLIFVHNSTSALLPLLISRFSCVSKIIYFNHGLPFLGYVGLLRFLLISLEKLNCFFSDLIITVSYDLKKKYMNLTKKNVNIIHNGSASGLDLKSKIQNINLINKIKKKLSFNTNDIIILYVGRPNRRKGFFDIIKIWDDDFKNKKNFKLMLLGINQNDFFKKIGNIPENIFPMGLVTETEPYFCLADYLFMTSHHEGLSYTILEAFKHRTVVISNNVYGVTELVKNGFNGFLVDKNNKNDYVKFLNYCEINQKLKKKMLDRSIELISKYSRQSFLKHYIKFIEKLKL